MVVEKKPGTRKSRFVRDATSEDFPESYTSFIPESYVPPAPPPTNVPPIGVARTGGYDPIARPAPVPVSGSTEKGWMSRSGRRPTVEGGRGWYEGGVQRQLALEAAIKNNLYNASQGPNPDSRGNMLTSGGVGGDMNEPKLKGIYDASDTAVEAMKQENAWNAWLAANPQDDNQDNGGGGNPLSAAQLRALEEQAIERRRAQGFRNLLGSGAFNPRDATADLGRISQAVSADQATAQTGTNRLADYIRKQKNSYDGVELTQARTLDPEDQALLTALGGDVGAYRAELGLANTLAGQGADADQRFLRQIAAGRETSRQDSLVANEQTGEFGRSELQAAGVKARAALEEKVKAENKTLRDEKMRIILEMIEANAAGGLGTDLSAYGLGGI